MVSGKISGDPLALTTAGLNMAAIQGGANVQAPSTLFAANANNLSDLADSATALSNLGGQPLAANLTSWAAITRAAGFDAFAASGTLPIDNGGTPIPTLATTVVLAAATVPNTINSVQISDYSALGDGGGHRRMRVTAQPSWGGIRSVDRFLPNGSVDAGNGGWWDVDEAQPNELMFGAVSSASNAVQTAAIQSLLDYCYGNPGIKAYNARSHTITAQINIPAGVCLEWGWGFPSAVFGQGAWLKGFNGDMIRMGDGSMLVRPLLQGLGATWTGRGIVIDQGNDQVIHDPFINDMAGPCIEFPTDSLGGRFRCYGGYFLRHTITDPCIVMPAVESITFGYRLFVNPGCGGGVLIAVKNGNMTQIQGGFSAGIDFTGNTTGRVFLSGHRVAAVTTITGLQHHISQCSFGAAVTLDGSTNAVDFSGNIVSGGITLASGCQNSSIVNNIITTGTAVVNNSGNSTNLISDILGAEVGPTQFIGAATPKADDGAALGSTSKKWSDLFLASGGVLNFNAGNYTVTHSAGTLTYSGGASWGAALLPSTDDGAALGSTSFKWSDAFFASGAVLNFNAGNVLVTHSAGVLTFTGSSSCSISASGFMGCSGFLFSSSATAGLGYASGAGGTVTQITSKATGVTLSRACGQITMDAAALAAGTIVSFVLTNTAIAATDVLILNHISGGTVGSYSFNAQCAAGSATINVRNNTAGSLSEAIVLRFALIKGVNA